MVLGEAEMAGTKILQRMGPKSKRELRRWQKQEKTKQKAIEHAFRVNENGK